MKLTYKPQYTILIATIILGLFGIVMIYSASSYSALLNYNDSYFFVKKQAIAFGAGIVVMIFGCIVNLDLLKKFKWVIYILSVVLLAIVFIPGVGAESYGATRWINLGLATFQPSEIAKFGLMIFLAAYMADNPPSSFKKMIIPFLAGMIICVLIIME
ncbi:MAG TPA: FtsW/RodA/SpoVE family cell cycle protein, partial [Clostridia bacterium]|nr:FtsW/RodA/SpoVE family cell cycle protein [Clostridia bacterium]